MNRIAHSAFACVVATALPLAALAQDAPAYPSPQEALDTLMSALNSNSPEQVVGALGPESSTVVLGTAPNDREFDWGEIYDDYLDGYRFVPRADGHVGFELGKDDWPFPIDVVRSDAGWIFDIEEGRNEIMARQVGLNELDVIDAMEAYVEIQREFRQVDHDGDGLLEFAAHVISSAGAHDGLYWPGSDSPVGDLVARASMDGFAEEGSDSAADPYLGYYFRILDAQGPQAPGGEMSYLVNGNMLAGHALLAVPAVYGESGVHSFLVSENGLVYEADLGEESLATAASLTSYNPDDEWEPVE
ncbi:DUF2950 family protein [Ruegeria hyattellae]|uniref:DUF2950 family protein n=1 Tax=Ruegeria hyattellae TaxID=3233337 RepID=UPI00355AE167